VHAEYIFDVSIYCLSGDYRLPRYSFLFVFVHREEKVNVVAVLELSKANIASNFAADQSVPCILTAISVVITINIYLLPDDSEGLYIL
jgi:hypothetical protein